MVREYTAKFKSGNPFLGLAIDKIVDSGVVIRTCLKSLEDKVK